MNIITKDKPILKYSGYNTTILFFGGGGWGGVGSVSKMSCNHNFGQVFIKSRWGSEYSIFIHSVNPLIYKGLRFLKNHGRGHQDFLVKMGRG